MKNYIITALILEVIVYLAFAFYTLHIDFRLWSEETRAGFLYISLVLLIMTGMVVAAIHSLKN